MQLKITSEGDKGLYQIVMMNSYRAGASQLQNKVKSQNQVVLSFYKSYPYNYLITLRKKLKGFCA